MTITSDERAAMCDLFEEVGPDAETLCEGWTTRDLLAHLLVRERRIDASPGILIPAFAPRTARVMAEVAEHPYADMITQFREGPPLWSPFVIPVLGDKANLAEFFVHHEDIRRGQPDWQPREDDGVRDEALWGLLKLMGRMLYRRSPVGVVLRCANRADVVAKKGEPGVIVVGLPGEIVLHAYGRDTDKIRIVVQGDPADIEAFAASPRGI